MFWALKIFAKLILARLPFGYRFWTRLNVFKHGDMDECDYAYGVLNRHIAYSSVPIGDNWKGLELGPGDGVMSALLATLKYNASIDLVDAGDFINKDVASYEDKLERFLDEGASLQLQGLNFSRDMQALLTSVNSDYFSDGLASLKAMPTGSYSFVFSQAVLEHIRRDEFYETMAECYRILAPDGAMSHVVDYKDHMGGALNNMRFPSRIWEAEWFASESGFYTNRIKCSEMIQVCEEVGFSVTLTSKKMFHHRVIASSELAPEFRSVSLEDLMISGAHLVMKKKV